MKDAADYCAYLVLRALVFLMNLVPLKTAQRLAGGVGVLLFYLMKKRRLRAIENLREAFRNEKSETEILRLARESFRNMAMIAPELFRIPKLAPRLGEVMEVRRDEIIRKVLAEGRGVVFLIFHYGNWELMGVRAVQIGLPTSAVGRPLKNRHIYRYIRNIRSVTGMNNIDKDGALKDAIRALRRATCVAVLCDQNAGARHPKVPFFGRPAHTFSTPIALALQTNSEVIPVTNIRQGLGHFVCTVHDPVTLIREGRREEILLENMKRMNEVIERIIREHPEQWLWMHNRWRIKS